MFAFPPLDRDSAPAASPQPAARTAPAFTSYRAALQNPTCALASHTGDRPDIATSAILGYN
ncbi:hypothetical protein [Burkholderia sp. 22PA0106]|uniref:hypothetical protein n=1 Tax=Burkholderia sp. 22PA0106 TaxID=3237371 RepID=UPI0039C1F4D9